MTVLHIHELGDPNGEPVLAVHGITAHGRRFRRLAEEAWPERRTVAVDLRGHGRSTYDGPWSVPQHVTDLLDTLDSLGLDSVDLVTHSYGGAIGLTLLQRAPERVRRLVLLDPALALDPADASETAIDVIDDNGWASIDEAAVARRGGLGDEYAATIAEELTEHLVEGDDGRFRFRYHKPAVVTGWGEMSYPLPDSVPVVPALVVVCDRADIVTPDALAGLRRLFGEHLTVEHLDSGHMLYWERFDDTARLVTDFLEA
ncbi:MAG TPA: alpha/beta fold hydrolase [Ilumatobacter sp.]|nr:alpha/beta fold hydrolase [Ilumatobacter sp.]